MFILSIMTQRYTCESIYKQRSLDWSENLMQLEYCNVSCPLQHGCRFTSEEPRRRADEEAVSALEGHTAERASFCLNFQLN